MGIRASWLSENKPYTVRAKFELATEPNIAVQCTQWIVRDTGNYNRHGFTFKHVRKASFMASFFKLVTTF